jgi:secreted trypsin-like serine protease
VVAISLRSSLLKLNHPECGITPSIASAESAITLRVTNGQEAEEGQFPWIVSLRYRRPQAGLFKRGIHKCGGTLIGERQGWTNVFGFNINPTI